MKIRSQIDPDGDDVAVFDPAKVLDKLLEFFPDVLIDPIDYSRQELDKITQFVRENDPAKHSFLISSYQAKYRRNGPTFKFGFKAGNGAAISGYARRYSVGFESQAKIDDETRNRIVEFLTLLKLGTVIPD